LESQEEKQRKLLRVRINMAKFLQETISESGLKANDVVKSDEFKQFFRKVRSSNTFARFFVDRDVVLSSRSFELELTSLPPVIRLHYHPSSSLLVPTTASTSYLVESTLSGPIHRRVSFEGGHHQGRSTLQVGRHPR